MSHTHHKRPVRRSFQAHIVVLGILSVLSSFTLGIKTAGDVETISPLQASDISMPGDVTADGTLSVQDAILILEIAQGYEEATPEQLLSDPNGDGRLTAEDALDVLHELASL